MWYSQYFPLFFSSTMCGKKLTEYENNLDFQNIFISLFNSALELFIWDNLPESCNARFLEVSLLTTGSGCIVKDVERGFLSLRAYPLGSNWNIYGETDAINGVGWNGFLKEYKNYMYGGGSLNNNANAIVCRDNKSQYAYINYITTYANRLSIIHRSIDILTRKMKTPYFINCDETQSKNIRKIIGDIQNNEDFIITSKSTLMNSFQLLDCNINPNTLTILQNSYNSFYNEIKTILGINNCCNEDKTERLLTDEINSNNILTNVNIDLRLRERQKFCETVNKHFGLNISVKINPTFLNDVTEGVEKHDSATDFQLQTED